MSELHGAAEGRSSRVLTAAYGSSRGSCFRRPRSPSQRSISEESSTRQPSAARSHSSKTWMASSTVCSLRALAMFAQTMSGGRVKLIVEGTNSDSTLSINPSLRKNIQPNSAHTYPPNAKAGDHLLHVGEVKITSGRINQVLGYKTADLSGPLIAESDSPVDRIAFSSYLPGTLIRTGGDLNTFDSLTDVTFAGSGGIITGRDLNWFNVGGNVNIGSGTTITVGRDLGLVLQPAKGSASGGQGGHVQGNLSISAGGSFTIARALKRRSLLMATLLARNCSRRPPSTHLLSSAAPSPFTATV